MLTSVFFSLQILRAFLVGSPDSSIASFQTLKSSGHSPYPEPVAFKWEGRGLLTRAVQEVPWCSEHQRGSCFSTGQCPQGAEYNPFPSKYGADGRTGRSHREVILVVMICRHVTEHIGGEARPL